VTSPMFGFSEQYRFEPNDQATRVSMTATAKPRGVFRFLAPVMTGGSGGRSKPITAASRPSWNIPAPKRLAISAGA
jgi:hypothetical protein